MRGVHTAQTYEIAGIDSFLDHINEYFRGETTTPVSRTTQLGGNLDFTYTDELLLAIRNKVPTHRKGYECAVKYGFQGYSQGGKNGIFLQRSGDEPLIRKTEKSIRKNIATIVRDLEISAEEVNSLRRVKIVSHNPGGFRIVGVSKPDISRAVFLTTAEY